MKLINFNNFLPFKKIREKMNIPKDFKPNFESSKAILIEMKFLEIKTKGLDISIEDLVLAPNKTLEHKDFPGQKMLVYIRDFNGDYAKDENNRENYPRFHIAWCKTLNDMHQKKKYERYVVSQRNDGIFLLNKTISGKVVKKDIELPLLICKNCLTTLKYKGYSSLSNHYSKSNEIFKDFNVKEFLDEYNTEVYIEPIHTSISQPKNEYPPNWNEISLNYRKSKKFICEECKKDCSKDTNELHLHHISGVKSDNSPSNLEALCIKCHSKQPYHGHMLLNPKYKLYL